MLSANDANGQDALHAVKNISATVKRTPNDIPDDPEEPVTETAVRVLIDEPRSGRIWFKTNGVLSEKDGRKFQFTSQTLNDILAANGFPEVHYSRVARGFDSGWRKVNQQQWSALRLVQR